MKNKVIYLVLLGTITFLCSWIICDLLYDKYIIYWDKTFADIKSLINPYRLKWSWQRWKLFGIERCCWLGLLILSFSLKFSPKLKYIFIALLDLAIGNVVDRVFFNIYEYGVNDYIVWIIVAMYLFKKFFNKQYQAICNTFNPVITLITLLDRYLKATWHKFILCWKRY